MARSFRRLTKTIGSTCLCCNTTSAIHIHGFWMFLDIWFMSVVPNMSLIEQGKCTNISSSSFLNYNPTTMIFQADSFSFFFFFFFFSVTLRVTRPERTKGRRTNQEVQLLFVSIFCSISFFSEGREEGGHAWKDACAIRPAEAEEAEGSGGDRAGQQTEESGKHTEAAFTRG